MISYSSAAMPSRASDAMSAGSSFGRSDAVEHAGVHAGDVQGADPDVLGASSKPEGVGHRPAAALPRAGGAAWP
jgi:hypothetical protein